MKKISFFLALLYSQYVFGRCCAPYPCDYHTPCRVKSCEPPECYSPPVYALDCSCAAYLTGDFLYWFGKDTNLIYLQETEGIRLVEIEGGFAVPAFFNLPTKNKRLKGSWRPGFRVGIGKDFSCDGWDVYANWTYFRTKHKKKKSVDPVQLGVPTDFLISPWTNPLFGTDLDFTTSGIAFFGFVPIYTTIKTKWQERINIIDAEIGRDYWLSRFMTMRPYLGVRGAWDRNTLKADNFLESTTAIISIDEVRFRNRFWGVGLLAGIQPSWSMCTGLSLFGNADVAILFGRYKNRRRENITNRLLTLASSPLIIPKMTDHYSSFQAILDLAAGIRIDTTFGCDRYYLALDLGWEQHYWFNHFCHYKFQGGLGGLSRTSDFTELNFITSDFDEVYGDFIFGGGYASLTIEF